MHRSHDTPSRAGMLNRAPLRMRTVPNVGEAAGRRVTRFGDAGRFARDVTLKTPAEPAGSARSKLPLATWRRCAGPRGQLPYLARSSRGKIRIAVALRAAE